MTSKHEEFLPDHGRIGERHDGTELFDKPEKSLQNEI
jgi:hypothetical protein